MRKKGLLVLLFLSVLLWAVRADAVRTMNVKIGKGEAIVAYLEGVARVASEGKDVPQTLKVNDRLKKGDLVSTGPKSRVELILPDNSRLRFADDSRFKLTQIEAGEEQPRDIKVHVVVGKAWANVSKAVAGSSNFALTCENAVAGVRGTVYRFNVNDDKSVLVRVYDGMVNVAGGLKTLEAPTVIGPPQKIAGPQHVAGPRKISREEWTFMIKAMQEIVIGSDGKPGKPKEFTEQEDRDAWSDWNKARDRDLGE